MIRRIRSNPGTRHAYSVILTAQTETEIHALNDETNELSIDEFIRKPLMSEVVRSLVDKVQSVTRLTKEA